MKQLLLSLLSLLAGLALFLCSIFAGHQTQSLLLMALAVVFLLLTIGILSYEESQVVVQKSKAEKNILNQ
jgi:hypothetical protein